MKKIIAAVLLVLVGFGSVFALDVNELSTRFNKDINDENIVMIPLDDLLIPIPVKEYPVDNDKCVTLFFPGVNSDIDYNPIAKFNNPGHVTDPGISKVSTTETSMEDVIKIMMANAPDCKQILIGHSQGGVRALAYANIMTQLGYGDRIKAVITIGSPVNGHPALVLGKEHLAGELAKTVNIIQRGINSLGAMDDGLIGFFVNMPFHLIEFLGGPHVRIDLDKFLGSFIDPFLRDGLGPDSDLAKLTQGAGLDGLNPRSDFARDYLGVKYNNGIYELSPILSPDTLVGFIVGENDSFTDLIADEFQRSAFKSAIDFTPEVIQQAVLFHNGQKEWFEGINAFGIFNDNINYHKEKCRDAEAARNWFYNYESNIADLFYGPDSYFHPGENYLHDCFIPTNVQFRELSKVGGTPVMPGQHVFRVKDAVHGGPNEELAEISNSHIWGTGKGFENPIGAVESGFDSIIPSIFDHHINNAATQRDKEQWQQGKTNIFVF